MKIAWTIIKFFIALMLGSFILHIISGMLFGVSLFSRVAYYTCYLIWFFYVYNFYFGKE